MRSSASTASRSSRCRPSLSGVTRDGERVPFEPIRDVAMLNEPLDDRVMAGFGGVAEYGITVRWDKNFLKIIRLLLERRDALRAVRRRALRRHARRRRRVRAGLRSRRARGRRRAADGARAAERPRERRAHRVGLPDGAAAHRRGQDELRRQHAGAAAGRRHRRRPDGDRHRDRVARVLPGAGREIPRRATRRWSRDKGREAVESAWTDEERDDRRGVPRRTRARFAPSGRRPRREGRAARVVELLQQWGGVTIAYRRRLIDSPSYTLNHEEVEKALEEGIRFAEGLTPHRRSKSTRTAARSALAGLAAAQRRRRRLARVRRARRCRRARSSIAAGTQPNTVLAREDAAHFHLDGKYFRLLDEDGQPVKPVHGSRQAREARGADRASCRWARDRASSATCIRRSSATSSRRWRARSRVTRSSRGCSTRSRRRPSATDASSSRMLDDELRATRRARRAADADDRRGRRARAGGGARASRPGSSTGCRISNRSRAARRRHAARDGRPGAHRRLGRSRAGPRLDDRARDGRLVGSVRAARSRASRSC